MLHCPRVFWDHLLRWIIWWERRSKVIKRNNHVYFLPNGLKPLASSGSASDHALFISCAYAILPQISRRVDHKILLQGFAGSGAWTDLWNYCANLRRNGGPYRARCAGPRSCAYVLVDTAKAGPVQRHAAHQRPLVRTDPDMECPELRKRYWGRRFWVRIYFSTTSGNVTDDIITQYLELHSSKWCYRRQPVVVHWINKIFNLVF